MSNQLDCLPDEVLRHIVFYAYRQKSLLFVNKRLATLFMDVNKKETENIGNIQNRYFPLDTDAKTTDFLRDLHTHIHFTLKKSTDPTRIATQLAQVFIALLHVLEKKKFQLQRGIRERKHSRYGYYEVTRKKTTVLDSQVMQGLIKSQTDFLQQHHSHNETIAFFRKEFSLLKQYKPPTTGFNALFAIFLPADRIFVNLQNIIQDILQILDTPFYEASIELK